MYSRCTWRFLLFCWCAQLLSSCQFSMASWITGYFVAMQSTYTICTFVRWLSLWIRSTVGFFPSFLIAQPNAFNILHIQPFLFVLLWVNHKLVSMKLTVRARVCVSMVNHAIIESISMSTHIKCNQSLNRMCLIAIATIQDTTDRNSASNVHSWWLWPMEWMNKKKQLDCRNVISVPKTTSVGLQIRCETWIKFMSRLRFCFCF